MVVNIISTIKDLNSIKDEWNDLLSRSEQHEIVFLRCEWVITWWHHFGAGKEMKIFTIRDDNNCLVAIFPFMVENEIKINQHIRRLIAIFNEHTYIYDFIVSSELYASTPLYEVLFSYLLKEDWHVIQLPETLETSMPADKILELAKRNKLKIFLSDPFCGRPYNPIDGTFEHYSKQLSKKFLKWLNRCERKLKELGTLSYELIENESISDSILNEAYNIEFKSWKGKTGTAILCHENLKDFYTDFGKIAAKNSWLKLYFLKVNDERIAFQYNVRYKNVEYSLKIGYKDDYAMYSPGNVLEKFLLENLYKIKLKRYEILGFSTTYKQQWNASGRKMRKVHIYNKSLFCFVLYVFEFGLKSFIRRIMPMNKAKY